MPYIIIGILEKVKGRSKDGINVLPYEVGQMENLAELQVVACNLKSLPTTMYMPGLHKLDVCGNLIKGKQGLPESIYAPNLVRLNLAKNPIGELPAEFFDSMKKLEYLDLRKPRLKYLPLSLTSARDTLKELHISKRSLKKSGKTKDKHGNRALKYLGRKDIEELFKGTQCEVFFH